MVIVDRYNESCNTPDNVQRNIEFNRDPECNFVDVKGRHSIPPPKKNAYETILVTFTNVKDQWPTQQQKKIIRFFLFHFMFQSYNDVSFLKFHRLHSHTFEAMAHVSKIFTA
jgi:hypothetical protein